MSVRYSTLDICPPAYARDRRRMLSLFSNTAANAALSSRSLDAFSYEALICAILDTSASFPSYELASASAFADSFR